MRLQIGDRIGARQAMALQLLLHPEVLADREAQPPGAAVAAQLQHRRRLGGAEVAALIEHVVAGQQPLAAHHPPAAGLHQGHGVVKSWPLGTGDPIGHPHQHANPRRHRRRQALQGPALGLEQGGTQQQVAGGVAPKRELRGEHQPGPDLGGPAAGVQDPLAISHQIPHQGIELGEGQAHQERSGEGSGPCRP